MDEEINENEERTSRFQERREEGFEEIKIVEEVIEDLENEDCSTVLNLPFLERIVLT